MNLSIGLLQNVRIHWNRTVSIQSGSINLDNSPQNSTKSTNSSWKDYIQNVSIEDLKIHKNNEIVANNLKGTLYPTVALMNPWMSIGKTNETWILTATLNEQQLGLDKYNFTGQMRCTLRAQKTYGPWNGAIENIRIQHRLFGTTMDIPKLEIDRQRHLDGRLKHTTANLNFIYQQEKILGQYNTASLLKI